jgi:hypothetical protein
LKAKEVRKDAMGVPEVVIRQMLCAKYRGDVFLAAEVLDSENTTKEIKL